MKSRIDHDRTFEGLAESFARNIYGTPKGRLRLKIIRDRMLAELPLDNGGPLTVLDVGGGLGQIACWLARKGHQVTLAEPAEDMLAAAAARCDRAGVTRVKSSLQALAQLTANEQGQYDLVVCHAVLEWLQAPQQAVADLASLVKPGGWLSVMFFNADALMFTNIVRGNWQRALGGQLAGKGRGRRLTPISPLALNDVEGWLQQAGLETVGRSGVRVFNDYLRLKLPPEATPERLLQLEKRYCQQEPFWRLGRYLLLHCRQPQGPACVP
ncbi:MAG: methyltransferase domain-containing protein [Marinobacter sp.]|nr:methyltransferase domain-containing protein [Marinobacter sp.]